jgi:hypothetical protein
MNGFKGFPGMALLCAIFCFCVVPAQAQQEVLNNGSFETGSMAPWQGSWDVNPGGPAGGGYCAHNFWGSGGTTSQSFPPVATNNIVSVTLWGAAVYNADDPPIRVTFHYVNGATSNAILNANQSFQFFTITNTLWPNNVITSIDIVGEGDQSYEPQHWVDGVSIMAHLTTPPVHIELIPTVAMPLIPAGGGFFDFRVTVENNGSSPQPADVWTMCQAPNSFWIGPIYWVFDQTLPPDFSTTRLMNQLVPSFAPSGWYTYRGVIGDYPSTMWDFWDFTFYKYTGSNTGSLGDWNGFGETREEVEKTSNEVISTLRVHNSPNPFNSTTTVRYELGTACTVRLKVYDAAGREVAILAEGWREAGSHEVVFNGASVPSGLYFARLTAGEYTAIEKLILLK